MLFSIYFFLTSYIFSAKLSVLEIGFRCACPADKQSNRQSAPHSVGILNAEPKSAIIACMLLVIAWRISVFAAAVAVSKTEDEYIIRSRLPVHHTHTHSCKYTQHIAFGCLYFSLLIVKCC